MRTGTKVVALVAVALAMVVVSATTLPALAAPAMDQTRDQLRTRDQSCDADMVSLRTRDRTREQMKSCDQTYLVAMQSGDQTQSRDQFRMRNRDVYQVSLQGRTQTLAMEGFFGGCVGKCVCGGLQARFGNCTQGGVGPGPNAQTSLQTGLGLQ